MADKVLRLIVGLFVGIYVARYLGPENFGILNFAMSFVALFGAFAKLGLDGIVVRNMVKLPESRDVLLGTAFTLRLFGSLLLLGLVYFALQFTNSTPLTQLIVLIIALGQFFHIFEVIEFYFQSQVQARQASIAGIVSLLISSIVKLVLIWSGASLVWFATAVVIEIVVKAIVLCVLYIKQQLALRLWRFQVEEAKSLLKDCWPLILSGLVIMIYMRIDQVMIKMMLGNSAVGNYAVAVRLAEAWYFVPVAITMSLFPAILNAKNQSNELFYQRLQKLYDFMIWLAIAVALPTTFISDWLVNILFGTSYSQASGVLAIYVWAAIPVFFGTAWAKWILAENHQKIVLYSHAVALLTNIILNYFLIKSMGLNGAAWSTTLSYSLSQISGLLVYRHEISINMFISALAAPLFYFRTRQ